MLRNKQFDDYDAEQLKFKAEKNKLYNKHYVTPEDYQMNFELIFENKYLAVSYIDFR